MNTCTQARVQARAPLTGYPAAQEDTSERTPPSILGEPRLQYTQQAYRLKFSFQQQTEHFVSTRRVTSPVTGKFQAIG